MFLSLNLNIYAQNIEDMNKKELRVALNKTLTAKDSLSVIVKDNTESIELLIQSNKLVNDSLKKTKIDLKSLINLNTQKNQTIKTLIEELATMQDSVGSVIFSHLTEQEAIENDDPPFEIDYLGVWVGKISDKTIKINLESYGNSNFKGSSNYGKLIGFSNDKDSKVVLYAIENNKISGAFFIDFLPDGVTAEGVWTDSNGKSDKISLRLDRN